MPSARAARRGAADEGRAPPWPATVALACRLVSHRSLPSHPSPVPSPTHRLKRSPPSEKFAYSRDVATALAALGSAGALPKWGTAARESLNTQRRSVSLGELKLVGVKAPDAVATPTVRNDAAFLATVVGGSSVLALLAGSLLPGDLSGFGAYLAGGVSIAVLAVGSVAPGLLSFFIDKFSRVFPDYRERVRRHEAAHFLAGYLLGVPVTDYSLDINNPHTRFAELDLGRRLVEGELTPDQVNRYAIVCMAGVTGEAVWSETVAGQTADLIDLQAVLNRVRPRLSDRDQQAATRWAVWAAAVLLRQYTAEYEALQAAMEQGASLVECVRAIEGAAAVAT